jgi:hypothetical protein
MKKETASFLINNVETTGQSVLCFLLFRNRQSFYWSSCQKEIRLLQALDGVALDFNVNESP